MIKLMIKGGRNERRREARSYQPSGRGGEGPEEGSIMSSEVTLYLHPLPPDPRCDGAQRGVRKGGREGWMSGWTKITEQVEGEKDEKCRNEEEVSGQKQG